MESQKTNKILYAIAYENFVTKKAGFVYMHAEDLTDARMKLIRSHKLKVFSTNTRIVGIAPAIKG